MILIGQYDSPFVRRVGIALSLYGYGFEHRPWSTFRQADEIAAFNPLRRVPTLVLDDGSVLVESVSMLEWLDERADAPLLPRSGPLRQRGFYLLGLACGLAEKTVALFYERQFHKEVSALWDARCVAQIKDVLRTLDSECQKKPSAWLLGDALSHADIMCACATRFVCEAHPDMVTRHDYPALLALCDKAESLEVFKSISQTFAPPPKP